MDGSTLSHRLAAGAAGGFVGTLFMTAGLFSLFPLLPERQQYPLPPRQITKEVAEKTGQEQLVDEPGEETLATAVNHFGYGAFSGAVYALVEPRQGSPWLKGMIGGLALWAGSYMGWLPALDIYPPAGRQPRGRVLLMIVAHMIWGTSTAWTIHTLLKNRR